MKKSWIALSLSMLLGTTAPSSVLAQQITGTPGSPSATTTIDGKQLPPPDPKFGGVIKDGALQSKPWWAPRVVPPKGAPNVLLIITDDAGFGVPSTFGGVIPTPTMDRIANAGLRYNRVFSTALCSPTRAALITGRNHHSVGFGVISEQSTGFPGYDSIITKDKATIGRILLDNGYSTSWFGKDHNTPAFAASQVGPFDQWPTGMGFEYFYGFVGGDANQWEPNLFRNTTQIYPFLGKAPGTWNLVTAMADDAIDWMTRMHQTDPSKPIFIKYAPGATHAPHHPTKEWVDKISADEAVRRGLEQAARADLREPEAARRDPAGHEAVTVAEGRAEGMGSTDGGREEALHPPSRNLRRVRGLQRPRDRARDPGLRGPRQARQHADHLHQRRQRHQRRGRAARHAERSGVLQRRQRAGRRPAGEVLRRVGHRTDLQPHVGRLVVGVRHAVRLVQAERVQLGGTNQNMVVSWPARIKDKGGLREQFMHVIDVVPTILEVAGIHAPEVVDGIKQKPIEGTSFAYTFDAKNAKAPSRHNTQYFEMMGQWALYQDGWLLSTKVDRAPWEAFGAANPDPLNNQVLELYDLSKDFSQSEDIAAKNPQKVKEMKQVFIAEAKKYQVFPLDASVAARIIAPRPNITAGRTEFVYTRPMTGLPQGDSPLLLNTSYTITADIEVPQGGAEGMILTSGGRFAGYGFYLLKGKPVFLWNLVDLERIKWEGARGAAAGPPHGRVRLQVRGDRRRHARIQQLQRPRPARHRHAEGGRQGGRDKTDGEDAADDPAVGRELRHRLRHAHRRQRRGLQTAIPVDRQV